MITNTSRRRMTMCWRRRENITLLGRIWMARKILPRSNERDDPNPRASRATTDDNGFAARGRVDGSVDGAAASLDPWGVSHERRARGRDRAQAQTRFRIPASKSRKNRREHELPRLDALHRSARLFLFDDKQLGLRAQCREAGGR